MKGKKQKGGGESIDKETQKMIDNQLPKDLKKLIKKMKPRVVYILMYFKADGQMNQPILLGTYDDEKTLLKNMKTHLSTLNRKQKDTFREYKDLLNVFFSNKKKTIFIPTDNYEDFDDIDSMQHNRKYGTIADFSSSGFTIIKNIINAKTKFELMDL